jgi:hypothetical protein
MNVIFDVAVARFASSAVIVASPWGLRPRLYASACPAGWGKKPIWSAPVRGTVILLGDRARNTSWWIWILPL